MNLKVILLNWATYASLFSSGEAAADQKWGKAGICFAVAFVCVIVVDWIAPRLPLAPANGGGDNG